MDEFIIKQFPETYIAFLEKLASNNSDRGQAQGLMNSANDAKQAKSVVDRQQIL